MAGFSVTSAERCLSILEMLASEPRGIALTSLSAALELPQSAVHRLLATLMHRGYARQDEASGHYVPTLAIAAVGLRMLSTLNIPNVCQPTLERLASRTGELVRLSAVEGGRLLWIARAQGSRSGLKYDPITGKDVPLHVTAMGKAWLATLPEDEAVGLVAARGFGGELIGPNAIRDEAALRTELKVTQARGYGLVREEAEAGVSAVAVLVRDGVQPGAPPVAAVSVAGPAFRLSQERLEGFVPPLREAARELSLIWPVRVFEGRRDERQPPWVA